MVLSFSSLLGIGRVMVFIDAGYLRTYCNVHYSDGMDGIQYDKLANFLAIHAVSADSKKPTLVRIFYYDAVPNEKDA